MTAPRVPHEDGRPTQSYDLERRLVALGQTADASTEATLYTCPVKRIAIGRVYLCNRSTVATIRIRIANAADDAAGSQWLVYDYSIPANEYDYTEELWLDAGSRIDVKASTATVSFTFNGYTIPKDTT